ncbi:MAG: hypothetical protein EU531_06625 [Promethearchaeota archaeon]|nr:MAG: hypothetical protein EU531_06625 [Candidatus Lokiarchaeota archaeon]
MDNCENLIDKELFLDKFEKLSLKIEQLTDEVFKMRKKMDKSNKINRSFGLKTIRNSEPLEFTKDVNGLGSPTKRYILNFRGISEMWKGRKNDILIVIRQQEEETHMDLKALGIRIPIKDIKNIRLLAKNIISLLYISCNLRGIEINDILRELLSDINNEGPSMVQEIKEKMTL